MYEIDNKQGKIMIELGNYSILAIKGQCKGLKGFKQQIEVLRQERLLK